MPSTTGPVGGSRARVIYHTPEKSFAWLHKDGSFADFQKALRARLNISKTEPLVIKQLDGDYTLDIETEEEYEAFCHFAKSASQLHISVNGGLRDQPKAGGIAASSSSTITPLVFSSIPAPQPLAESEDPTLGKRKASKITTDLEATPSVTQKRKKRRKVGPDQSISAVNNSAITPAPPEPEGERETVPEVTANDAARTSVPADTNQSTIPQTQKKKKRKQAGEGQSDSTPAASMERGIDPSTEPVGAPEPPPAGPSKTKKRKTVVLDLSTVIQPPVTAQEPPSTSTVRPSPPVTEPSSMANEVTKKSLAKRKTKTPAEPPEPTPATLPVPRTNVADEPVSFSTATKPKPPVSKSGLTRPQVYVEIITKKGKTGKADGLSTVEKETKQQDPVKKPGNLTVRKPKGNTKKSKKAEPTERIDSPNALSIQEIMDGVIAAAMKRGSTAGTTTDVSENFTPPPRNNSESTVGKSRPANASSLEPASSTTLLDTTAPAPRAVDSDAIAVRKRVGPMKSHIEVSPFLKDGDDSSLASNVHPDSDEDPPASRPLLKSGAKPSALPTATPPIQKAMKDLPAKAQPEESASSEDGDSATPEKKPAPVSNPDDELDAFLYAPMHPSQKSVLEELPSDSEDEEEEAEREDMEVDEEDEVHGSKRFGRGQSKVIARAGSSSDNSDSESVAADTLVKADQVEVDTQATHVSATLDAVPSSDLEDEGMPLSRPNKPTNTSANVVAPASSTSDSPEPHMTPISNLKSAGRALSFFNDHVLDKPDPIENDPSHVAPVDDPSVEDPIENADATSTPKPRLVQQMKGRSNSASPTVARKSGVGSKTTQSSLTSPSNTMLPPPTPSRDPKGDFTFSQPLDQSTPAVTSVSRRKQLISQTTVPETPAHSTWTTLPRREPSTQSMDDPSMVDELIPSPIESAGKLLEATPPKRPTSLGSTNQTPLFFPGTSQYPIPSSDLPVANESSSEESEEEGISDPPSPRVLRSSVPARTAPPAPRVLRSTATKNRTTTPYRSLSVLASQRSIFPSTPIEPVGPTPVKKSQTKSDSDDDDDEEDSGVSDSDSDSPPPSHIPKGRRAGTGNRGRGRRNPLTMWS